MYSHYAFPKHFELTITASRPIQGRIKALRGPSPKIFCGPHERQQSPQLPSSVNTRGYIKQATIQNIFHSFRETDYSYAYTFL